MHAILLTTWMFAAAQSGGPKAESTAEPMAEQASGPLRLRIRSKGVDSAGVLEIGLADLVEVEMEAMGTLEKGALEVIVPQPLTRSVGWRIRKAVVPDSAPETGKERIWRGRWWLEPRTLGETSLRIEPFRFLKDGQQETAVWKAVTVRVASTTPTPDMKFLREDGVDIETLPTRPPGSFQGWVWLGGASGAIGLALAGWWWFRRGARRSGPIDPATWAKARLVRLESLDLPARGASRRFVFLLNGILRRFLERKYGLAATRRTTQEFLGTLAENAAIPEERQRQLAAFLTRCDLVKFASPESTVDVCRGLAAALRSILDE